MKNTRTHVVMDGELLREIDQTVGARKRSQFLSVAARKELGRLWIKKALGETHGLLKASEYPEFRQGGQQWISKLRKEDLHKK